MQWKATIGVALLGLCSFAANGQSAQSGQPDQPAENTANAPHGGWRGARGSERQLEMLTRMLSLTPEQQTGLKALLDQQTTQIRALRSNPQGESANAETPEVRQARMTQMNQIRDETDTKISALLDDNQKKTFSDWVARRKAAMARRQGPGGNPPADSPTTTPQS
jgi:Spy/CpxP family protein refolding chaperone